MSHLVSVQPYFASSKASVCFFSCNIFISYLLLSFSFLSFYFLNLCYFFISLKFTCNLCMNRCFKVLAMNVHSLLLIFFQDSDFFQIYHIFYGAHKLISLSLTIMLKAISTVPATYLFHLFKCSSC